MVSESNRVLFCLTASSALTLPLSLPVAYRDLPRLLSIAETGQSGCNVQLSLEETYADITPVRLTKGNTHAFLSIMRGCANLCSYCIGINLIFFFLIFITFFFSFFF